MNLLIEAVSSVQSVMTVTEVEEALVAEGVAEVEEEGPLVKFLLKFYSVSIPFLVFVIRLFALQCFRRINQIPILRHYQHLSNKKQGKFQSLLGSFDLYGPLPFRFVAY